MTGRSDYGEGWSTDEEDEGLAFGAACGASRQGGSHCGLCGVEVREGVRPDGCAHRFCWHCFQKWASQGPAACPTCHHHRRSRRRGAGEALWQEGPPATAVDRDRWHSCSADVAPEADNEGFIAEDNVMCLQGASCRVRSGFTLKRAELSVACDSCDRWFHASCVAFDRCDSPDTWICPPCHLNLRSPPPSLQQSSARTPQAVDSCGSLSSGEKSEEGQLGCGAEVVSPRREALIRIAAKVVAEMQEAEAHAADHSSSPPPPSSLSGDSDLRPAEGEECECPARDADASNGPPREKKEGEAAGEEGRGEGVEAGKDEERSGGEEGGVGQQAEVREEGESGEAAELLEWLGAEEEGGVDTVEEVAVEPVPARVRVEEKAAEESREAVGAGEGVGADVEDTFMAAYKAAAEITKQRREAEAPKLFGRSEQAAAKRKDEAELKERFGKRRRIEGRRAVVGGEGGIEESAIDAALAPKSTDIRARAARAAALLGKKEGRSTSVEGRQEGSLWARLPDEMKPTLKLNLRSRIPTAIRQTYLSRWVSLFLHKARLPVIGRNAETERAVGRAVKEEADIFGGAGSKAAYETVSRRSLAAAAAETEEGPAADGGGEEEGGGMGVDEALLATGLVSDSPPPTPPSRLQDVDDRIQRLRPAIMEHVAAERGAAEEWEEWAEEHTRGAPGGRTQDCPVGRQVEVFVREHLQPLVRSGVIRAEQSEWAARKAAAKVMQHHASATSAEFLISEGSKVRRLAEVYVESYRSAEAAM